MKALICMALFAASSAHAVDNIKVFKQKSEIVKMLEKVPVRIGFLDAAIYNSGESVTALQTSTPSKEDIRTDPINIKAGDRFFDLYLQGRPGDECDYGPFASFTLRRGKYLPKDLTANWFMHHICMAPTS